MGKETCLSYQDYTMAILGGCYITGAKDGLCILLGLEIDVLIICITTNCLADDAI